ncbi:glutamine gamma-glutamyltransferase [Labeo rohita]|uniref:protein-glutamine gamma-glutamyltransferase n=1 Tax=Labeo rohita TaxID=84645 RepID=A0A498L916_LABRO|nr:glutamine gamma-glutamyltransferase [Labeo rohita]
MNEFRVRSISLQQVQNQTRHKTEGLSSTTVVLRRGQAFTVAINYDGRPFDPLKEKMIFSITLGPLIVDVPVSRLGQPSLTQWTAIVERNVTGPTAPRALSVSLSSPASASIGVYTLQLRVETRLGVKTHSVGQFTLLCNPWSQADSVYLQSEDLRTEYVKSDNGVLFIGSAGNVFARPWSFDQYEKGILDICMKLLQLSPQYRADMRKDLQKCSNPVYIGRVISAMVNSNDDKGVLMGNWSGHYSDGVNPSMWTGSADILKKWAETQFRPVKYGQCWVFAAVMCTVMRALGIPTRVITNFNSAHDTNNNMVIEEYYDENGRKLSIGNDSIWNFHVWVESWMKRPDLGQGYDGWQVLDATPQERSTGTFRCGPASVKAVYQRKVEAKYDVPFVYAEVNADVHLMVVRDKKVLSKKIDKHRVGALILTKLPGSMRRQDVTSEYKNEWGYSPSRTSNSAGGGMPFRASSAAGDDERSLRCAVADTGAREASKGVTVSLKLLNPPVVGENISFNVVITNNEAAPKQLKKHVNAQNKEYNRNPTGTFWEAHDDVKIGPNETVTAKHEITFKEYMLKEAADVFLVNLAVVIEDVKSQEKVLASEEFNICNPTLNVQIQNESSVIIYAPQVATVTFVNPFNTAVSGELTISGSGLLEEKAKMKVTVQPRETMKKPIDFTPRMAGSKMLSANLVLTNPPTILHGFTTINVQRS